MKPPIALVACACVVGIVVVERSARADDHGAGAPGDDPFVRVSGNQFILRGRPFHFVGANLAIMHGPDNRAAAEEVLGAAARDGVKVARIWALGEGAADAVPWIRDNFLFRAGESGWIDAATAHLDRVIAAAGRAGVRLIITLANGWSDYGGVPRYLKWTGRWKEGVYGVSDRFYSDARARAAFRAHVERLLTRTNQVTGVRYRDDPTILGWELMNESSVATTAGAAARRSWIVEMARVIHARDPQHLVTPGIGGYRFERERRDWLTICRLPEVDFCDGHVYPEELLRDREADRLDAVLDDYVRLAQTLARKPFVLGEFGVRGDDGGGLWRGHDRAWWTTRILERLRLDGGAGGLIWIYQGSHGTDRTHGITVGGAAGVDPVSDAIRAAIRNAATTLEDATADPGTGVRATNPSVVGDGDGDDGAPEKALMPLHAEFAGRSSSVPLVRADDLADHVLSITWNPTAYARADWESSGIYSGGAIEHVWGAETGWFEYQYIVMPPPAETQAPLPASTSASASPRTDTTAGIPATGLAHTPRVTSTSVRARMSSEYPGALSPPDGASWFEVSLDDVRLGAATAPRDDGRGQWVTVRATGAFIPTGALASGRHRLRFTITASPHAHGLSIYGRDGEKPAPGIDTGPIELRIGVNR